MNDQTPPAPLPADPPEAPAEGDVSTEAAAAVAPEPSSETPAPAAAPPEAPAEGPAPAATHETPAAPTPVTTPVKKHQPSAFVKVPLPTTRSFGYVPSTIELSLTPRQARAAQVLRHGFAEVGRKVHKAEDGVHHLLDLIADELEDIE